MVVLKLFFSIDWGQAMAAFDLLLGSNADFLPETLLGYMNLYFLKKQICRAVELLMIHYHASRQAWIPDGYLCCVPPMSRRAAT